MVLTNCENFVGLVEDLLVISKLLFALSTGGFILLEGWRCLNDAYTYFSLVDTYGVGCTLFEETAPLVFCRILVPPLAKFEI